MILRDRDANTAWEDSADATLEERTYYCQNWRADVIALMTDAGQLIQQVRYDPYGVPFGVSKADVNGDGTVNTTDITRFGTIWNGGSGTHPLADWNFDGSVNTADYLAFINSYNNDTALGRGDLSYAYAHAGGASRKGYAGYEIEPVLTGSEGWESIYHVRNRVYLSQLGRWTRRDPLGYVDGMSVYVYTSSSPILHVDPNGLISIPGQGDAGCGIGGVIIAGSDCGGWDDCLNAGDLQSCIACCQHDHDYNQENEWMCIRACAKAYKPSPGDGVPVTPIKIKYACDILNCSDRRPTPDYAPQPNGCGAKNGFPIPEGPFYVNFSSCCDDHDVCYGTCGTSKYSCDSMFQGCMMQKCLSQGWGSGDPRLWGCVATAKLYYKAVKSSGGSAYCTGQTAACICCDPPNADSRCDETDSK